MPNCRRLVGLWTATALVGGILTWPGASRAADEKAAQPETAPETPHGHSSLGEAFNEGPRQRARRIPGTGPVRFPVTTANPEAQQFIEQGVGQLHGFWWLEAERSFRQAAALDPGCAMAYWGMARANVDNEKRAKKFLEEALRRREGITRREQMYLDALEAHYKIEPNKKKERGEQYVRDLEKIVLDFPDDQEAKAFLALQLWLNRSQTPIASHVAVDALLKQVLAVEPMHPCHHYVIHLWDNQRPEQALASAALCGPAAPAIAHMWHMPGHIYSRLKRYHDAVWQQEASARVDHAHMIQDQLLPDQIHNFAHNNEWLIRNLNHVGQVRDALALAKNMVELPRHPRYNHLGRSGSARYGRDRLLETLSRFELWDQLVALADTAYLEPTDVDTQRINRWRYLGMAQFRRGDVEAGRCVLAELQSWRDGQLAARDTAIEEAQAKIRQEAAEKASAASPEKAASTGESAPSEAGSQPAETADKKPSEPAAEKEDPELTKRLQQAKNEVENRYKGTLEAAEKALHELRGYQAAAEKKFAEAQEHFKKAGSIDEAYRARLHLQAGQADEAEKVIRQYVDKHPQEVVPLAAQVDILWQLGKREAAQEAFIRLRSVAGTADLDVPPLARLSPVAEEFGWPSDWRQPQPPASDLGPRPPLDELGPARWHPPTAPAWSLTDASGTVRQSKQYQGRPVILIFYLGYGCLHCAQQLQAMAPRAAEFRQAGIELVAISTDSQSDLHKAIGDFEGEFPIQLVSDEGLQVFRAYRAYDDFENKPLHGTFLIDGEGRMRWQDIGHEPFMEVEFLLKESQRLLALPVEP